VAVVVGEVVGGGWDCGCGPGGGGGGGQLLEPDSNGGGNGGGPQDDDGACGRRLRRWGNRLLQHSSPILSERQRGGTLPHHIWTLDLTDSLPLREWQAGGGIGWVGVGLGVGGCEGGIGWVGWVVRLEGAKGQIGPLVVVLIDRSRRPDTDNTQQQTHYCCARGNGISQSASGTRKRSNARTMTKFLSCILDAYRHPRSRPKLSAHSPQGYRHCPSGLCWVEALVHRPAEVAGAPAGTDVAWVRARAALGVVGQLQLQRLPPRNVR
jgi:hypothetical protein